VSVLESTALVLALLSDATQAGSWAAIVGLPHLGLATASELVADLDSAFSSGCGQDFLGDEFREALCAH
jgi:hypothetical protein